MILAAPLQGYTEAPWRHYHRQIYGGVDFYYMPFMRVEGQEVRPKDIRDLNSKLNADTPVVPQIIFKDISEFQILVDAIAANGYSELDLNLGCPFPPQMNRGRGCDAVHNARLLRETAELMAKEYTSIKFSIKMRLGAERPDEWRQTIDIINSMSLKHVTLHPRIGSQHYSGELHLDQFSDFQKECTHPLIFNGDILTISQISEIRRNFPDIKGVMLGRGLLSRPSLAIEYISGEEWPRELRIAKLLEFHALLFRHYGSTLCGEAQILSKIKPFWDYLEAEIGHKPAKAIRKATTLTKYHIALNTITP